MEQWQSYALVAGAILGPLSGIIVALVANHRSKKDTTKTVRVQEKEADTHMFSALVDGFVEQIRVINENYDDLQTKYTQLNNKHAELERGLALALKHNTEMEQHIVALETLVPNPPGPPTRPWARAS